MKAALMGHSLVLGFNDAYKEGLTHNPKPQRQFHRSTTPLAGDGIGGDARAADHVAEPPPAAAPLRALGDASANAEWARHTAYAIDERRVQASPPAHRSPLEKETRADGAWRAYTHAQPRAEPRAPAERPREETQMRSPRGAGPPAARLREPSVSAPPRAHASSPPRAHNGAPAARPSSPSAIVSGMSPAAVGRAVGEYAGWALRPTTARTITGDEPAMGVRPLVEQQPPVAAHSLPQPLERAQRPLRPLRAPAARTPHRRSPDDARAEQPRSSAAVHQGWPWPPMTRVALPAHGERAPAAQLHAARAQPSAVRALAPPVARSAPHAPLAQPPQPPQPPRGAPYVPAETGETGPAENAGGGGPKPQRLAALAQPSTRAPAAARPAAPAAVGAGLGGAAAHFAPAPRLL